MCCSIVGFCMASPVQQTSACQTLANLSKTLAEKLSILSIDGVDSVDPPCRIVDVDTELFRNRRPEFA